MNRPAAVAVTGLRKSNAVDWLWVLFFGGASAWWCLAAAHALSATFDEPLYLHYGLEHWRTGSCGKLMKLGTMPLALDVQTLPLFLWEKWRGIVIDPVTDIAWAVPWARAGTLAFWAVLLAYAWRTASALGGRWAGRIAVAILACEPVFLAHASLATSDLAVTACLLAFLFEFRAGRDKRWPRRVLLAGVLYGIAILAKASALVFGVIGMFAIEVERLRAAGMLGGWRDAVVPLRAFVRETAAIVGLGLAVAVIYCGSDWLPERSFLKWAQSLPVGGVNDLLLWIADHLRIFPNGAEALVQQIKHNMRGHSSYILGTEYRRSVWFYFPVALSMKTTLPLLLLPLALAVVRRRSLWNWPCLAAGTLLLFSLNCRVQIGVRFMLPLLALLAIGMAIAVMNVLPSLQARGRVILIALLASGIAWNAAAAAYVWPNALCYTNPAWGGTPEGYRLLSDSNYDWGQGLLELKEWSARHGVDVIDVWYFGTDPRVNESPLRGLPLHTTEFLGGRSVAAAVEGKVVAVSTTILYGASVRNWEPGRTATNLFRAASPSARTTTFLIYDFRTRAAEPSPPTAAAAPQVRAETPQ